MNGLDLLRARNTGFEGSWAQLLRFARTDRTILIDPTFLCFACDQGYLLTSNRNATSRFDGPGFQTIEGAQSALGYTDPSSTPRAGASAETEKDDGRVSGASMIPCEWEHYPVHALRLPRVVGGGAHRVSRSAGVRLQGS